MKLAYNLIGIESNGKGDFIVHNSRIYDNQQLGAKNIVASQASSSIQPIEAQNNWWGDNSGPQANNNPEGKGDKVIGLVLFDPWIGKNSSNLPVVFVPGIGACMNLKVLTDIEPWSFDWKLFGHYYDGFIKTMQTAGYKLNKNFFIACYDWRKTNGFDLSSECDSGEEYLRHWIGEAKKSAKTDQVILVAHSMGGLIARSYIQSQRYDNDVKKLIILGTPNHGSAEAYYPWEGGQIPEAWQNLKVILKIYLSYLKAKGFDITKASTIHNFIPSLKQLLPTYDFLINEENQKIVPINLMSEKNDWLINLNRNLSTLQTRVPTAIIYGSKVSTLNIIAVRPRTALDIQLDRWVDGRPDPQISVYKSNGDGTVIASSTLLPGVTTYDLGNINHSSLPNQSALKVLDILGTSTSQNIDYVPVDKYLAVTIASPANILVSTKKRQGWV